MAEELAAAYGVLPQAIVRMAWVKVRELWISYTKRQRRTMRLEGAMRGMDTLTGVTAGSAEGPSQQVLDELVRENFPVRIVRT